MSDEISQIILDELRAHRSESAKRHEDMDVRVRKVEKWQANADGKITMVGIFGVFLGGVISWLSGIFRH